MTTYEEFMVILTVGLLIVAILNLKNKQSRSVLVRLAALLNALFCRNGKP